MASARRYRASNAWFCSIGYRNSSKGIGSLWGKEKKRYLDKLAIIEHERLLHQESKKGWLTSRQADRETDTQTDRQRLTDTDRQRLTDRQSERLTDTQTDRKTDRQRLPDTQTAFNLLCMDLHCGFCVLLSLPVLKELTTPSRLLCVHTKQLCEI